MQVDNGAITKNMQQQLKPATLDDVVITEELSHRATRLPNLHLENQGLHTLARQLVKKPEIMLQNLVELALDLCQAGSAGVSLLEQTPSGEQVFRWAALAGALAPNKGGTAPCHFSPCGVCLSRGAPQLYSYPHRYFTYFQEAKPQIVETLVLPLFASDDYPLGTIWIVSHDEQRKFDLEDVRVMMSLADFTAAALLQKRTVELLSTNNVLQAEITERKRVEAALRESEEKYRRLFNSMGEAFALCELILEDGKPFDVRILEVNPAHETMTGLTAEKTIGRTIRKLIPDIKDWWFEIYGRVVLSGEKIRFENFVPGLNRWFDIYAYKIEEDNDRKFALIYSDITGRKQALVELHQSEERYRTLFESIDEGFCVIEMLFDENDKPLDYRFLEINPEFEKQTGLKNAQGKTARELVPNLEEHWFEIYGKVALTGEPVRFENGSFEMNRWFDVYAVRIGQQSSRKVAVIFKDISEAKRNEVEREKILQREQTARETAERANRIKDEFLAVLSHELRSPLNPILGWTRLLRSGKLNEAKTVEALATIERNAQLQTQLISDLLDISRIMRGKLTLNAAPVSLSFVISAALETVQLAAEAKTIQIEVISETNIPQVYGDAGRLQQVIWNLLSNAVKFTPTGGQVEIHLTQANNFAQIQITDTGKGINSQFLPYVFEHFRQEDSAITRKFGGLGLGLAIARQITELHGGRIWVESLGENQGATFTVELPLLNAVNNYNVEATDLNIPLSSRTLVNKKVLVVDDEPDSRNIVAFVVEQAGAEVIAVSSAVAALQMLSTVPFDILISDIGMPEMDGYALMRQIRQLPTNQARQIPAIALTAYAGEYDQQQAHIAGFGQHMSKPADPIKLVQCITKMLKSNK